MKNAKRLLAVVSVVSGILATQTSQARDHWDGFEYRFSGSQMRDIEPEVISSEGIIRCKNGCPLSGGDCNLEFARTSDGETFDVSDNPKLRALHCCDRKSDLKVKLVGELESRFLFWGGDLIVKTFEVQGEIPAQICSLNASSDWGASSNIFSRGDLR